MVSVAYVPGVVSVADVGRWSLVAAAPALVRSAPATFGHWCLWSFAAWMVVGLSWSASPLSGAGDALHLLALVAAFCVGASRIDISPVPLAVGVLLSFLAGVVFPVENATGGFVGLFLTRAALAEISSVAAVWALARGYERGDRTCAALGVLLLVPALLPGVREIFLGFSGAALVLVVSRHSRLGILVLVAAVSAAVVTVAVQPDSAGARLEIWTNVVSSLSWLGSGAGSFAEMFPSYEYAHSDPLQFIAEYGVGALPLAGVLFYAFCALGRIPEKMALAALASESLVGFPLHSPTTAIVAAVLAGRLCSVPDRVRHLESLLGEAHVVGTARRERLRAGALSRDDGGRASVASGS